VSRPDLVHISVLRSSTNARQRRGCL
jgi:hypothetical protein